MDSQKQQAAERIKQANNILVTVSNNPSVDQLAACIGLTVALNKMGKHATAVFSGVVPSTIEFLQPEKTLEKNTDSLRDFIIALDKSKADKLRYKVEDRVVKIFITPYKTSISNKDLEFSQGDFNVDVVLALGVHNQVDLDQAITSHGRILHDATVITLNSKPGGELGGINWLDPAASSLSELGVQLVDLLDKKLIDTQIATALLTGIVAETDRFSNAKTSPQTMSLSAELMAAGANQQLVSAKLEEPAPPPPNAPIAHQGDKPAEEVKEEAKKPDDGTLEIAHDEKQSQETPEPEHKDEGNDQPIPEQKPEPEAEHQQEQEKEQEEPRPAEEPAPTTVEPEPEPPKPEVAAPQIHIDEHGSLSPLEDTLPPLPPSTPPSISHHSQGPKMVLAPPAMGDPLAAGVPGSFGEPEGTLGLPDLPSPTANIPNLVGHPVGQTIMPPASMDEAPSGGAAPIDSFLVSEPTAAPPSFPASQPPQIPIISPTTPVTPEVHDNETLSQIEKDVQSPHLAPTTSATPAPATSAPTGTDDGMLPPLPPTTPATDTTAQSPLTPLISEDGTLHVPNAQTEAESSAASEQATQTQDLNSARDAVAQAINGSSTSAIEPIQALNAQTVDLPMGSTSVENTQQPGFAQPTTNPVTPMPSLDAMPAWNAGPQPQQQNTNSVIQPQFDAIATGSTSQGQQFGLPPQQPADPNAPPAVPPPMMPPANPY